MNYTVEEKLKIIQNAAEDKKGVDITTLSITEMTSIADYFVIVSGNSIPQVQAIQREIEEKMEKAGYELLHSEGISQARWIILDYNEIIVHIFHREDRDYYGLERLWMNDRNFKEEEK